MTSEELAAIKARAEAATPGPWTTGAGKVEGGQVRELVIAPNDDVIVAIAYGGFGNPVDRTTEDRTFIAHARTDVSELIAEVERLRALIAETVPVFETLAAVAESEYGNGDGSADRDMALLEKLKAM